jgi:hypothetical protein
MQRKQPTRRPQVAVDNVPRDPTRKPPRDLPKRLFDHFEDGLLYIDTDYDQKDEAKRRGARWDAQKKRWYVPRDVDWKGLVRWLPPEQPEHLPVVTVPPTLPGRIARYYLSVLEESNPDDAGNSKHVVDGITFDELDAGQLRSNRDGFGTFWKAAREKHAKSMAPLEPAGGRKSGQPEAAAICVTFGFMPPPSARCQRRVVLLLPALVEATGKLVAAAHTPPVINEAYYEPQDTPRSPVLGRVDALHERSTKFDWPGASEWPTTWAALNALFKSTTDKAVSLRDVIDDAGHRVCVWSVAYDLDNSMVRHLRALYAQLVATDPACVSLYAGVCEGSEQRPTLSVRAQRDLAVRHTGHMSASFGLDPTQREALRHLLATEAGRPLAVSGPPGTGKTACLQGVIATTFVNAALAGDDPVPPIVIASSATNQAVTNIIKAFGGIADTGDDPTIASRWVSDIKSYGWYFASKTAAESGEYEDYQLLRRNGGGLEYGGGAGALAERLRGVSALPAMQAEYLRAFRCVFPKAESTSLDAAIASLLSELRRLAQGGADGGANLAGALAEIEHLTALCVQAGVQERRAARRKLAKRAHCNAFVAARRELLASDAATLSAKVAHLVDLAVKVRVSGAAVARKGTLAALVAWVHSIRLKKRRRLLIAALEPARGLADMPTDDAALMRVADEVLATLRARLASIHGRQRLLEARVARMTAAESTWLDAARPLAADLDEMERIIATMEAIAGEFLSRNAARAWSDGLRAGLSGATVGPGFDAEQGARCGRCLRDGGEEAASAAYESLDQLLDRTMRRRCFDVAARYWEGRWLLETARVVGLEESVQGGLRRQCMLAPVVVATAYMMPSLFRTHSGLLDLKVADLLVIDEAGQADPAVSVGLFALGRRAIVVGDVEQLKPIWRVAALQDAGFLRQALLDDRADDLRRRGLRASSGSAMLAAQAASAFSAADKRGITLIRHYRSRPTVIEFCNRLVYDKVRPLIPVTREDPGRILHPMSYVECDTAACRRNGSVANDCEAQALIDWLRDNRARIERHYNTKGGRAVARGDAGYRHLDELVGIVAPFAEQVRCLQALARVALDDPEGKLVEKMKLGTVHKLQGAERPLVLFSATNSPEDGGSPFMDANPDMLNVAVSRAQDAFVLFGHPGIFFSERALRPGNYSPSAVLGRYMKKFGKRLYPRRMVVVESPGKIAAVQSALGRDCVVLATKGHIREIAELEIDTAQVRWEVIASKQDTLSRMVEWLADMDEVVIATDDDREGDAIGWHLLEVLQHKVPLDGITVTRMVFHEVTGAAIQGGFAKRLPWADQRRAQAAVTRAVVDKAIGQVVSAQAAQRLRQRGAQPAQGVGRVRAALLRLVAQHEAAAVSSMPGWRVRATVRNGSDRLALWATEGDAIHSSARCFAKRQDAEAVAAAIRSEGRLKTCAHARTFTLGPAAAVGTADVLIAAYEKLGLAPGRVAKILQDLYEGNRRAVDAPSRSKGVTHG